MKIITGEENIELFRMCSLRGALKLEIIGLKRRGQSAYSIIKKEFKLKGNRARVFDQFDRLIKEKKNGN